MFHYEKKLQFPVKIATPNPKLAAFIISQYGGPDSIRLQVIGYPPANIAVSALGTSLCWRIKEKSWGRTNDL